MSELVISSMKAKYPDLPGDVEFHETDCFGEALPSSSTQEAAKLLVAFLHTNESTKVYESGKLELSGAHVDLVNLMHVLLSHQHHKENSN